MRVCKGLARQRRRHALHLTIDPSHDCTRSIAFFPHYIRDTDSRVYMRLVPQDVLVCVFLCARRQERPCGKPCGRNPLITNLKGLRADTSANLMARCTRNTRTQPRGLVMTAGTAAYLDHTARVTTTVPLPLLPLQTLLPLQWKHLYLAAHTQTRHIDPRRHSLPRLVHHVGLSPPPHKQHGQHHTGGRMEWAREAALQRQRQRRRHRQRQRQR